MSITTAMLAAHVDRCHHIVRVAWHDDADRDLAIVGGVGRVERAAAGIEADFAADRASQICGKVRHDLLRRHENTKHTMHVFSCVRDFTTKSKTPHARLTIGCSGRRLVQS
jgi:hypothetical protein